MTTSAAASGPPAVGPWVEEWLSGSRYAVYLTAAGGDRGLALALYEWNAQLSAAFLHDLAHLEVGLRNAYDRALAARWPGPPHWTARTPSLFAPVLRRKGNLTIDVNRKNRENLDRAVANAGGVGAPAGKVLAELMFGFWRYMSSAAHEKTLWVPALHRAFPPKTSRVYVDQRVGRLHELRNRVAHHEPLLNTHVAALLVDLLELTSMLSSELGQHVAATSNVLTLVQADPRLHASRE